MTFWSGETLRDRLPGLITPFDEKAIDCAAYTLSIGPEIYVSPTLGDKRADSKSKRKLAPGEGFTIPPGQFAFLTTRELVEIPKDSLGLISMRATWKWRGLINVSGFHVDPGFRGNLTYAVFNCGPSIIHLAEGDPCMLIWYVSLDRESTYVKKGEARLGLSSDLLNAISGGVESIGNLKRRVDKVEKEQSVYRGLALFVGAVTIGISLKYCDPIHDAGSIAAKFAGATVAPASRASVAPPTPIFSPRARANAAPRRRP